MKPHIYKAPNAQYADSNLITLFDGTGSMSYEYESAVNAHQQIFSNLGNQKQDYQFGMELQSGLLPFLCAGSASITKAFKQIFQRLIENQNQYQKNICIIFLSDGEEEFDLQTLLPQIEMLKKIYSIMFVSVAFGKCFPPTISNLLRYHLHTQGDQVRSFYTVERNLEREEIVIQQECIEIFKKIDAERKTSFFQKIHELNFEVSTNLLSAPQKQVKPCETFIPINQNQEVVINNEVQKASQQEKDVEDFIGKSVHTGLIEGNKNNYQELFNKIEEGIANIVQHYPKIAENIQQNNKLQQVLALVDSIVEGNIKIDTLDDQQKTKIQEGLFSEKVDLVEEIVKCTQIKNTNQQAQQNLPQEELTQEKIIKNVKKKMDTMRVGCYVRSRLVVVPQTLEPEKQDFKLVSSYFAQYNLFELIFISQYYQPKIFQQRFLSRLNKT